MVNIYLASSWRNEWQPGVLADLRSEGYEVYDFRNPGGDFHWSEIEKHWRLWTTMEMVSAFGHPLAIEGFQRDMDALAKCDICVMLMPSGRSSALELGWAAGQGKKTAVLVMEDQEPELMLKMADFVTDDIVELVEWLREYRSGL